MPEGAICKHYWIFAQPKGIRWVNEHALAKCRHCPAWSVIDYNYSGIGPCPHVVGSKPLLDVCEDCNEKVAALEEDENWIATLCVACWERNREAF